MLQCLLLKSTSCWLPQGSYNPQKFIAYGALYGAPLPDDSLVFGRYDFTYAEPTTDGNGGLTGALAGLAEYFDGQVRGQMSYWGLEGGVALLWDTAVSYCVWFYGNGVRDEWRKGAGCQRSEGTGTMQ